MPVLRLYLFCAIKSTFGHLPTRRLERFGRPFPRYRKYLTALREREAKPCALHGCQKHEREKEFFPMAQTGTVKFFNTTKGFGFITPDGGAKDVFVHISAVEASGMRTLVDGQKVTFEVEPDRMGKGPKAVNLRAA